MLELTGKEGKGVFCHNQASRGSDGPTVGRGQAQRESSRARSVLGVPSFNPPTPVRWCPREQPHRARARTRPVRLSPYQVPAEPRARAHKTRRTRGGSGPSPARDHRRPPSVRASRTLPRAGAGTAVSVSGSECLGRAHTVGRAHASAAGLRALLPVGRGRRLWPVEWPPAGPRPGPRASSAQRGWCPRSPACHDHTG